MGLFNKRLPLNKFYPTQFIDIHNHLLPGIDDGAKSIEDSLNLVNTLEEYGVTNFINTPHVLGGVWENSSETIKNAEAKLKQALKENGKEHINIHASAEYMMDDNFMRLLKNNDILPLKDKYILVEMSFFNPPFNLEDILFQIQFKGYIPVLAHPERYAFYHNDLNQYKKLIDAGCLFQLNLLSLTSQYGDHVKKTAYKLIKEGYYTFVGSDTHHSRHLKLMQEISNTKNKKLLDPLFENNIKYFGN